jgi:putative ABC transport system substrate-binding protein
MRLIGLAVALTLSVSLAPLATEAQQAGKIYRIGFLSYLGCGASSDPNGAFHQSLRQLGYVEGRNLVVECRDAPGRVDHLAGLAAELVRLKIDVLVAEATPASLAAQEATTTVPIVMLSVADPVRSKLVKSLARPGGNVTGVSLYPVLEIVPKVLELLKEVIPSVSRVGVLWDPTNPAHVFSSDQVDVAASALGLQLQRIAVRAAPDIPKTVAALSKRTQALFVYPLPMALPDIRQIAEFALKNRLPAVTFWDGYAEQGLLMFYGSGIADQYRRAGSYVDKILKGAKPADLPVEQPTKFELAINLKTAKALGLTIPQTLLQRADQVIQ